MRVASRALTEKEREKLTVYLHKGAAGDWDFDLLANEFELDDLLDWGFDKKELDIDLWAGDPPEDVEPQIDKAEELREKWGVESGQLWKLGEHRLICGDCTDKAVVEKVMQGEQADCVMTDPPYGMGLDANFADIHSSRSTVALGGGKQRSHNNYDKVLGDNGDFDFTNIAYIWEFAPEVFLWGADYYIDSVPEFGKSGSWIVWDKKPLGDMAEAIGNQFEMCLSKQRHKRIIIDYTYSGAYGMKPDDGHRVHPTQKPVDLIKGMLDRWGKSNDIVVDFFLGSGTTLIACERLGRKCRAVEISPAYVAVAIQRWVDVTNGTPELLE